MYSLWNSATACSLLVIKELRSTETVSQFLPIIIILPLLYTHISFTYDWRYVIVATDSVVK